MITRFAFIFVGLAGACFVARESPVAAIIVLGMSWMFAFAVVESTPPPEGDGDSSAPADDIDDQVWLEAEQLYAAYRADGWAFHGEEAGGGLGWAELPVTVRWHWLAVATKAREWRAR